MNRFGSQRHSKKKIIIYISVIFSLREYKSFSNFFLLHTLLFPSASTLHNDISNGANTKHIYVEMQCVAFL